MMFCANVRKITLAQSANIFIFCQYAEKFPGIFGITDLRGL